MAIDEKFAFDPMDASKAKNWDFIRSIRHAMGVCRPAEGLLFTARYEETASAFRNARSFSSAGDMRAPGVLVPDDERFLGELDAPLHPRIRRILLRGFTPAAALAAEGWTRNAVASKLQAIARQGGGDLMDTLAIPLPGSVAAHALGIPDEMHEQVMQWCNDLLHSTWPTTGKTERGVGIEVGFPELSEAIDDQIRRRREAGRDKTDDLLAVMVHTTTPDGWRIPEAHIRTLTINILAGSLSASYMIGNLLFRYLSEPGGFARTIREDRSAIPVAVEESLRLEPPVLFMFRHATEDTELGGCPISAGDHLMLSIASANRDERLYPDAEQFRLDRGDGPEHLAFGAGPHLCLGNHITRMVGRVVLEEMVDRFRPGYIQLAPDFDWVCVDHMLEYGPEHLQVVVVAKP
jgi:cytochrome P450